MPRIVAFDARPLAALAAAGLLALGGCGSDDEPAGETTEDDPPLTVELSSSTVAPGGTIRARVRNDTDEPFTYGAAYQLAREVDGEFEPVPLKRAFIQIAYVAEPGELGPPVAVELPGDAEPGRWRVILEQRVPELGGEPLAAELEVVDD